MNFSEPFESEPSVIVAPEKISDQGGCVGNYTDAVIGYPENITTTGFDLRVGGSPFRGSCGTWE